MPRAKNQTSNTPKTRLSFAICLLIVLMAVLMIMPVSVALSAGIAGLSLVLFGVAIVLMIVLLRVRPPKERFFIVPALGAAVFGFIFPQIAYLLSAQREDVTLTFDPLSYVTFSGATTLEPTRIMGYKTTPSQNLELAYYRTSKTGQRPAVLLLHGGGWRYGSHLETGDWPRLLTAAGFHVVSIQYRLANDTYHTWRDAPSDVHDALAYVQAHAAELAVDPAQLHLLGQSAGGHLALLEAYLHDEAKSVVSLYAPIDLALDYATSRDGASELDFIGGPPKQYANRYRAASPITYVSSRSPRTLIIQGKTDDLVVTENATLLSEALTNNRIDHEVVLLPMTGHSFENQRGGFATQIAEQRVLRFLSR